MSYDVLPEDDHSATAQVIQLSPYNLVKTRLKAPPGTATEPGEWEPLTLNVGPNPLRDSAASWWDYDDGEGWHQFDTGGPAGEFYTETDVSGAATKSHGYGFVTADPFDPNYNKILPNTMSYDFRNGTWAIQGLYGLYLSAGSAAVIDDDTFRASVAGLVIDFIQVPHSAMTATHPYVNNPAHWNSILPPTDASFDAYPVLYTWNPGPIPDVSGWTERSWRPGVYDWQVLVDLSNLGDLTPDSDGFIHLLVRPRKNDGTDVIDLGVADSWIDVYYNADDYSTFTWAYAGGDSNTYPPYDGYVKIYADNAGMMYAYAYHLYYANVEVLDVNIDGAQHWFTYQSGDVATGHSIFTCAVAGAWTGTEVANVYQRQADGTFVAYANYDPLTVQVYTPIPPGPAREQRPNYAVGYPRVHLETPYDSDDDPVPVMWLKLAGVPSSGTGVAWFGWQNPRLGIDPDEELERGASWTTFSVYPRLDGKLAMNGESPQRYTSSNDEGYKWLWMDERFPRTGGYVESSPGVEDDYWSEPYTEMTFKNGHYLRVILDDNNFTSTRLDGMWLDMAIYLTPYPKVPRPKMWQWGPDDDHHGLQYEGYTYEPVLMPEAPSTLRKGFAIQCQDSIEEWIYSGRELVMGYVEGYGPFFYAHFTQDGTYWSIFDPDGIWSYDHGNNSDELGRHTARLWMAEGWASERYHVNSPTSLELGYPYNAQPESWRVDNAHGRSVDLGHTVPWVPQEAYESGYPRGEAYEFNFLLWSPQYPNSFFAQGSLSPNYPDTTVVRTLKEFNLTTGSVVREMEPFAVSYYDDWVIVSEDGHKLLSPGGTGEWLEYDLATEVTTVIAKDHAITQPMGILDNHNVHGAYNGFYRQQYDIAADELTTFNLEPYVGKGYNGSYIGSDGRYLWFHKLNYHMDNGVWKAPDGSVWDIGNGLAQFFNEFYRYDTHLAGALIGEDFFSATSYIDWAPEWDGSTVTGTYSGGVSTNTVTGPAPVSELNAGDVACKTHFGLMHRPAFTNSVLFTINVNSDSGFSNTMDIHMSVRQYDNGFTTLDGTDGLLRVDNSGPQEFGTIFRDIELQVDVDPGCVGFVVEVYWIARHGAGLEMINYPKGSMRNWRAVGNDGAIPIEYMFNLEPPTEQSYGKWVEPYYRETFSNLYSTDEDWSFEGGTVGNWSVVSSGAAPSVSVTNTGYGGGRALEVTCADPFIIYGPWLDATVYQGYLEFDQRIALVAGVSGQVRLSYEWADASGNILGNSKDNTDAFGSVLSAPNTALPVDGSWNMTNVNAHYVHPAYFPNIAKIRVRIHTVGSGRTMRVDHAGVYYGLYGTSTAPDTAPSLPPTEYIAGYEDVSTGGIAYYFCNWGYPAWFAPAPPSGWSVGRRI